MESGYATIMFQFHKVQLKDHPQMTIGDKNQFQFHKVQLKVR